MNDSSPSDATLSLLSQGITERVSYDVCGINLSVIDYVPSYTANVVIDEIRSRTYDFDIIPFEPGDVVLDLGGNVGIVSIYLAKKYPFLKIYAYEPAPNNHAHFLLNLSDNNVQNVQLIQKAVTQDGRLLHMAGNFQSNSGSATAQIHDFNLPGWSSFSAESTTLDAIFKEHDIERCKLLKVDIEGSEYEVLLNAGCLDRVEYFIGEFHLNGYLRWKGYSVKGLHQHLKQFIPEENISFTTCDITE